MKTTIKIDGGKALVIEPAQLSSGVNFNITIAGFSIGGTVLTVDQCGALLFAMEQALEAQTTKAAA